MSPFEALQTSTTTAAKVVNRETEIGQVKEGFFADLVILDGNPLEDLAATQKPFMTIKNGKVLFDAQDND